jgi:hypothetical protein
MDCLSLLETSSVSKSLHFANATQFFTFNQIYGLHFWHTVMNLHNTIFAKKIVKETMFMLPTIYHSSNTQWQLFANKGDLHLSETSAEFLLEPWLVIQLPWHPAVYHQWLIAALAEVLKALNELVEFYWWPVPKKLFAVVGKLLSQVETLYRRILTGFRLINWLSSGEDSGNGFETNCQTVECILNMIVLPSLPVIEFLVSNKFDRMVRALKRLAWLSKGKEEADCQVNSFEVSEVEASLPVLYRDLFESGAVSMFGKTSSLPAIKKELSELPYNVAYAQKLTNMVSNKISFKFCHACTSFMPILE